jgi:hypothetical protein
VKSSRAEIHRRVHGVPEIRFDDSKMTSFAGLVVFQLLFKQLSLKKRLRDAFGDEDLSRNYGLTLVVTQLVVAVLLGFRRLRDRDYFASDPLILRVLGVSRLPDVATISRTLGAASGSSFIALRKVLRGLVLDRLETLKLGTVTLDFDGSVLSSRRHAEGSAIGYNKKRKGARSYYPLFCTVSQTGQFFDLRHRPGNVHDSRDSETFIAEKVAEVRRALPGVRIETRLDSAFFSEEAIALLHGLGTEYSVSVPFERFTVLRARILRRTSGWRRIDDDHAAIEINWRPKSWSDSDTRRFIAVRTRRPVRLKGPLQLDIFEPLDHDYEYKVFITNKRVGLGTAMRFHNGRGNQEAVLGEGKHWAALDYVPCRRLIANQLFSASALLAHNLARELQMATSEPRTNRSLPTRAAVFEFANLGTLRDLYLRRAGALARPARRLTLTIAARGPARAGIENFLRQLQHAA